MKFYLVVYLLIIFFFNIHKDSMLDHCTAIQLSTWLL